jgi:hypothetical protein
LGGHGLARSLGASAGLVARGHRGRGDAEVGADAHARFGGFRFGLGRDAHEVLAGLHECADLAVHLRVVGEHRRHRVGAPSHFGAGRAGQAAERGIGHVAVNQPCQGNHPQGDHRDR